MTVTQWQTVSKSLCGSELRAACPCVPNDVWHLLLQLATDTLASCSCFPALHKSCQPTRGTQRQLTVSPAKVNGALWLFILLSHCIKGTCKAEDLTCCSVPQSNTTTQHLTLVLALFSHTFLMSYCALLCLPGQSEYLCTTAMHLPHMDFPGPRNMLCMHIRILYQVFFLIESK